MANYSTRHSSANELKVKEKTMFTKTFYIAGVQHHEFKQVLHDLQEGQDVDLIPDPKNKFDKNAIALTVGNDAVMLGYVPKKINSEVLAAMVTSVLRCKITKLNKTSKPWEMIEVTIDDIPF